MTENEPRGCNENHRNHHAHKNGHSRIDPSGSLYAANIQQREHHREENLPAPNGNSGRKRMRLLRAPDGADQRVEHVIHHHAPAGYIAGGRMDFLGNIGERRTRTWISSRHPSVGNTGEEHGHHSDQDGGHHVSAGLVADDAVNAHGRDRLDHDDAVQHQVA